jgi:hypothetical protein
MMAAFLEETEARNGRTKEMSTVFIIQGNGRPRTCARIAECMHNLKSLLPNPSLYVLQTHFRAALSSVKYKFLFSDGKRGKVFHNKRR